LSFQPSGERLHYVGGRSGQVHRLRAIVQAAQAEWLHHDGGLEARKGLLAGLVNGADAVFFPVDCVSHDTAGVLKRLCRQAGKPYLLFTKCQPGEFRSRLTSIRAAIPVSIVYTLAARLGGKTAHTPS
jgi:hypothetical protein